MVLRECLPGLGGRSARTDHILSNRGFANVDAELLEFAVNTWRTPARIGFDLLLSGDLGLCVQEIDKQVFRPNKVSPHNFFSVAFFQRGVIYGLQNCSQPRFNAACLDIF